MANSTSGVAVGFERRIRERPAGLRRWGKHGPVSKLCDVFKVTSHYDASSLHLNALKPLVRSAYVAERVDGPHFELIVPRKTIEKELNSLQKLLQLYIKFD